MIKINMAVEASTHEELLEALKSAGPNVHTFYGEVVGGKKTEITITPAEPENEAPAAPENAPPPEPVYDITEVRALLAQVRESVGSEEMRDILRKHGAEKLPDLNKAHYAAVMKEATECLQRVTPS